MQMWLRLWPFFWEATSLIAKRCNVQTHSLEPSIRNSFIPNTSPKCKIEIQNNHSMMCFKNVPDVFLHSCRNLWSSLPTWAIPMQENNFLLLFPWTLLQFAGHYGKFATICGTLWALAGILQACTAMVWSGDQIFVSHGETEHIMLCEGTRSLPLFTKVIRTDSTAHSFSQTAE